MIKLIVLSAFRNLWRNKVNTLINLISLSIGLTVFAFAFVYVKKEVSYNKGWHEADRIHRFIIEQNGLPGQADGSSASVDYRAYPGLARFFDDEYEGLTRVAMGGARLAENEDGDFSQLFYVDPDFDEVFQPEVIKGNLSRSLDEPGFIAFEESFAETLGDVATIGNRITLQSNYRNEVEFEVGAIYRLPENITNNVTFTQVVPINEYSKSMFVQSSGSGYVPWESGGIQMWTRLAPWLSTEIFNEMNASYLDNEVTAFNPSLRPNMKLSDVMTYRWQPITEMHLHSIPGETVSLGSGDATRVTTIAVVGMLVLLVGCSNSISLSLATVLERRRETGIRKSAGALPSDIRRQYQFEAMLLAFLAFIPMTLMLTFLKPLMIKLSPGTFSAESFETGITEYLMLAGITLIVGLINGLYPSLVLSRVRPQAVLRPSADSKSVKGINTRSLLVMGQFFLASVLLIGTATLYTQLSVTRAQPLGFTMDNLLVINIGATSNVDTAFTGALRQQPGVQDVVSVLYPPNMDVAGAEDNVPLIRKTDGEVTEIKVESLPIGTDYIFFEVFGIPLIAGRYFDEARDNIAANMGNIDVRSPPEGFEYRYLVNRATTKALGFSSPEEAINQLIYRQFTDASTGEVLLYEIPIRIIGVVEDSMFSSFRRRPGPQIYQRLDLSQYLVVQYEDSIESTVMETVHAIANNFPAIRIGNTTFLEDHLKEAFRQEQQESRLLLICGGMALLLSCIGLYGLAAFSMERNTKEVGVRKVLGAAVPNIMGLYLWRFAKPVLIASLLACPVAIYFVLQWIQQFPYQLEKAWLLPLCLGASGTVLVIALMTVSLITARAATRKPVESLRYE